MNFSITNSLKNVFLYGFSSIISRGLPFLLLPLLTSNLSEEEYGVITFMSALMLIINAPVYMGLNTLIDVDFFKISRESFIELLSSVLYIPVLISIIFSILLTQLNFLSDLFNINLEYLVYIPVIVLLNNFYLVPAQLFRLNNQAVNYFILELFYSIIHFIVTFVFVKSLLMGVEGRIFAWFATGVLLSFVSITILYKFDFLAFRFNYKKVLYFLGYGIKLMPHQIGSLSLRVIDRIFINMLLGMSAAGSYAVGYQIASISLVFISVINMAWIPFLFKKLVNPTYLDKVFIVKLTYFLMFLFFAFNFFVYLISEYIYIYFIDSKFSDSISISNLLLIGFFINSVYSLFSDYLFYTAKNHILSYVTVFNLALTSILYLVFIPIYHLHGAVYSSIFSMTFTCIVTVYLSNKVYPMPWFYWFGFKCKL